MDDNKKQPPPSPLPPNDDVSDAENNNKNPHDSVKKNPLPKEKTKKIATQKIELDVAEGEIRSLLAKITESSQKSKIKAAKISGATFLAGMLSVAAGLWINVHDRRQQLEIKMINLQVERLRNEREAKIALKGQYDSTGTSLRTIRELEIEACKLGLRETKEQKFKFFTMRLNARKAVVETFYGMRFVFKDVPYVVKLAEKLTIFDESIDDVCNGPGKEAWQERQVNATGVMEQSIFKTDNELKQLEVKLQERIDYGWF
ncbi:MAG: hypothetical protein Tsb005_14330 [Gammaproteobacteria bacterium]